MSSTATAAHARQDAYVRRIESEGFGYEFTIAGAFVRSIRDLGYKNAATAIDELIDNAIEAGAQNVHVAFGFGRSNSKPEAVAILDDGYGMLPTMLRASIVWGGTDREGSRQLFGRYGYGLPSASVSQGTCFTVYSRTGTGNFYGITLDVLEIGKGRYIQDNRVVVPLARVEELPDWVAEYAAKNLAGGLDALRTAVVWEDLDRITWKTATALEQRLLEHFGVTYRNWLRKTAVFVNGNRCEPLDPLFTTPGNRFYDYDEDRAEALPPLEFKVKAPDGKSEHQISLRISYMPPTFLSIDKQKTAQRGNANPRFSIRKDHAGVIVCRNGRQIDVVTRNPLTTFLNNDRYIGLELDFPAELDELFGVTTAKQQITISQSIWDHLDKAGFMRILKSLRRRWREDQADEAVAMEKSPSRPRPSETVMNRVEDVLRRRPPSAEQEKAAAENLEREVERISKESGLPLEKVKKEKERESRERPYKLETESLPAAPFFRVEQRGGQLVLLLNRAHRFYTDVYAALPARDGTRTRAALELLLFSIGQCELDGTGSLQSFYLGEKIEWSKRFDIALASLDEYVDAVQEVSDDEPDLR